MACAGVDAVTLLALHKSFTVQLALPLSQA